MADIITCLQFENAGDLLLPTVGRHPNRPESNESDLQRVAGRFGNGVAGGGWTQPHEYGCDKAMPICSIGGFNIGRESFTVECWYMVTRKDYTAGLYVPVTVSTSERVYGAPFCVTIAAGGDADWKEESIHMGFYIDNGRNLRITNNYGSYGIVNLGQWYHLALTFEIVPDVSLKIYGFFNGKALGRVKWWNKRELQKYRLNIIQHSTDFYYGSCAYMHAPMHLCCCFGRNELCYDGVWIKGGRGYICSYPLNAGCGAIDEFIVTKGLKYTGDFTPATSAYTPRNPYGKKFYGIGNSSVFSRTLWPNKVTTPSIFVKDAGTIAYGDLASATGSGVRVGLQGSEYSYN